VFKKLYPAPNFLASDLNSFQRQESILIVFNLVLLSALVFLHYRFASFWGSPSWQLMLAAMLGFFLQVLELSWIQGLSEPLTARALTTLTWSANVINLAVAISLGNLTNHEDSPYFVLMLVPILRAAFRFEILPMLAVVTVADLSLFIGVWRYYQAHPPVEVGEYFEAGTTSLMLLAVGEVVWVLVRGLREKEARLANNLLELERTRERLVQEERLAAVGRLSSAIAHEIRNPVAMICSSIATAKQLSGPEKEEMFEIASHEANRLVQLTTEFLSYARPRFPEPSLTSVADTLAYVADACRASASDREVQIQVEASEDMQALVDPGQLQQALIDLILNAAEGAAPRSTIHLRAHCDSEHLCIDVENCGQPIAPQDAQRIFEPFFTTKPTGTGLGLAIARNIARAHGGDVVLSTNESERIRFSLTLPLSAKGGRS
jgi:signal transduction histidine kinase